jgi:hypothetical protein
MFLWRNLNKMANKMKLITINIKLPFWLRWTEKYISLDIKKIPISELEEQNYKGIIIDEFATYKCKKVKE